MVVPQEQDTESESVGGKDMSSLHTPHMTTESLGDPERLLRSISKTPYTRARKKKLSNASAAVAQNIRRNLNTRAHLKKAPAGNKLKARPPLWRLCTSTLSSPRRLQLPPPYALQGGQQHESSTNNRRWRAAERRPQPGSDDGGPPQAGRCGRLCSCTGRWDIRSWALLETRPAHGACM